MGGARTLKGVCFPAKTAMPRSPWSKLGPQGCWQTIAQEGGWCSHGPGGPRCLQHSAPERMGNAPIHRTGVGPFGVKAFGGTALALWCPWPGLPAHLWLRPGLGKSVRLKWAEPRLRVPGVRTWPDFMFQASIASKPWSTNAAETNYRPAGPLGEQPAKRHNGGCATSQGRFFGVVFRAPTRGQIGDFPDWSEEALLGYRVVQAYGGRKIANRLAVALVRFPGSPIWGVLSLPILRPGRPCLFLPFKALWPLNHIAVCAFVAPKFDSI